MSPTPPEVVAAAASIKPVRIIPKMPVCPQGLSDKAIELITQLCFRPDTKKDHERYYTVDTIFVFGTTTGIDLLAPLLSELVKGTSPSNVIIAGGIPNYLDSKPIEKSQGEMIAEKLALHPTSKVQCVLEEESQNSKENVVNAAKHLIDDEDATILIVTKAHSSWRQYLTLRKHIPKAVILQRSWPVKYSLDVNVITAKSWMNAGSSRSRVWGEVLRFKEYTARGDLAHDDYTDVIYDKLVKLVPELR